MRPDSPALILGLALALLPSPEAARAQGRAGDELVSSDPLSDDPIGIDARDDLADVAGPPSSPTPRVTAQSGEVLTAINAVRETHHAVAVTLADGLADVTVALTFASRARHPAEVGYRLAVPPGAALSQLEVCIEDRCRSGLAVGDAGRSGYEAAVRARGPAEGLPIAWAETIEDDRGTAIAIRAAPVPPRGTLVATVRYIARAPIAGGIARMSLPGRGQDPRAAPTTVTVRAPGLIGVAVDEAPAAGPLIRDAWYPIPISARLPTATPTSARIERFVCGDARCARATITAGPRRGAPVDLVLAVDASPSTEGPARSRIGPALAAILSATPPGSRVWAVAFGAEARTLIEAPRGPADVPLVPLARAVDRELGSATRFESAWGAAEPLLRRRAAGRPLHLVIVGDGGITRGPEADAAFDAARSAGVRVSVVDVADRATWAYLAEGARRTGGIVVEAGAEAELAARGRTTTHLEERVARIFAPVEAG